MGADGKPYEIFHLHPQLIACLLAQGFILLEDQGHQILNKTRTNGKGNLDRNNILDVVLGPALDLLIWIPKEVGNRLVTAQRPLQLPPPV